MAEISEISVDAFKLPPAQAVAFFEEKGFAITWDWTEQLKLNNARVFTVAKAMKMSVLQDIRGAVDEAIKQGTTFSEFKRTLEPKLRAAGWWGKFKTESGQVQLGSPHRLKTIYNTNVQSSYNAGRWNAQEENADNRPYLQYVAVLDGSTRPSHAQLNGQIHPVNSTFWDTFYPANGYNCRCRTRALTKAQAEAKGGVTRKPAKIKPDEGFDSNPGKVAWTPKRSSYDPDIYKIAQPLKP